MIDVVIQGLMLGGLYSLFALGLSLMFGVMRLTNIAQGDFIVLGAFAAIALASTLGSASLAGLALVPAALLCGYVLQRYLLNRTLGRDPLPSLVVTFGLSILIQNGLLQAFSADPRSIPSDGLNTRSLAVGDGINVGVLPLMIFLTAAAITLALQLFFARTSLGRAFRAVSDDAEASQLMGLDPARVYAWATGIALAVTAVAGVFQGLRTTVAPSDGPDLLLFAFEAVVMGGMGSFWGAFIGAMVLGLAQQIGFRYDPGWGLWVGHLVFLSVLIVRPQGLFPKTRS